jgi:hypothetical protein
VTHNFSCSVELGAVSIKNTSGHVMQDICFCIRWDLRVKKCILVRPGHETSTHYFSCSGWLSAVSLKSKLGLVTQKMCFPSYGICGHVVHSGQFVVRNGDTLFLCSGGVRIRQKTHRDTLHQNCVFASYWICGSCSKFSYVRGTNQQHNIFHAQVGQVRIRQKTRLFTLRRTCVFASSGICGSRSAFGCFRDTKR